MYGDPTEDPGLLFAVLVVLFMFTVLGGWGMVLVWWEKVYDKTPAAIRKILYAAFMITAFYFAIRWV